MTSGEEPVLDTRVAYSARVNNYWHGGKDNFAKDREAAQTAIEAFPELPVAVRAGVKFRVKAVTLLAGDMGVRQFLDLGTGLPAGDPIHRIAQHIAPESRVVYVDNDRSTSGCVHGWGMLAASQRCVSLRRVSRV